jgi:hypothetical protein
MGKFIRTNIHFTEYQLKKLRVIADTRGMSVALLVRMAVNDFLSRELSRTPKAPQRKKGK